MYTVYVCVSSGAKSGDTDLNIFYWQHVDSKDASLIMLDLMSMWHWTKKDLIDNLFHVSHVYITCVYTIDNIHHIYGIQWIMGVKAKNMTPPIYSFVVQLQRNLL